MAKFVAPILVLLLASAPCLLASPGSLGLSATFDSTSNWSNCPWPILQQGACGDCYAFSAAETLTARMCIAGITLPTSANGAPVVVSPTTITGCNAIYGRDNGETTNSNPCGGGFPYHSLYAIYASLESVGTCDATDATCADGCLPYMYDLSSSGGNDCQSSSDIQQSCSNGNTQCLASSASGGWSPTSLKASSYASQAFSSSSNPYWTAGYIPPFSPDAIAMEIYYNGPVSVNIRIPSSGSFSTYWYNLPSATGISQMYVATEEDYARGSDGHSVQIVGWTTFDLTDDDNSGSVYAYKVRNSWGDATYDGGDAGYFYVPISGQGGYTPVNNMFIEATPSLVWLGYQSQGWAQQNVNINWQPSWASYEYFAFGYSWTPSSSSSPSRAASGGGMPTTHTATDATFKYIEHNPHARNAVSAYLKHVNRSAATLIHADRLVTQVVSGMKYSLALFTLHNGELEAHNISLHVTHNLTTHVLDTTIVRVGNAPSVFSRLQAATTPSSSTSSSSSGTSLSAGAVAGIAVACVLVGAAISALFFRRLGSTGRTRVNAVDSASGNTLHVALLPTTNTDTP